MRTLRLIFLLSLTSAIPGCGQKGALVLPDAQRPRKQIGISRPPAAKPATSAPAPAAPNPAATPAPTTAPLDPAPGEAQTDAAPQS